MLPTRVAFVDIETTGLRFLRDRIIEIGIIRMEDGVVTKTYQTLVNPNTYLPPEISQLTGIDNAVLENAPSFSHVAKEIAEILSDCVFVAHNARFDYSFLKQAFFQEEMTFSPKQLCTVKLFKYFYPRKKSHNLDSVMETFAIPCKTRHRAFDDALVLVSFYEKLLQTVPQEELEKAYNIITKKPSLPVGLSQEDIKALPNSPGVYIFYGSENIPLYIGKSVSIRDRVLSHFSSDIKSPFEMKISQQVKRIATLQTKGELGALLKEATLIKQLSPLYNKKLRNAKKLVVLLKTQNDKGYDMVTLTQLDHISKEILSSILALFSSKKKATDYLLFVSKEYDLCTKLLGIEHTKDACFAFRLGRCKGACKDKEKTVAYNFRFQHAFLKTKIHPWPFNGPIAIYEKNTLGADVFYVDNWCFLGSNSDLDETISQESLQKGNFEDSSFDVATYKILSSYIKNPKNQQHIMLVSQLIKQSQAF